MRFLESAGVGGVAGIGRNKCGEAWVCIRMNGSQRHFKLVVGALMGDLYRYAYFLCRDRTLSQDLVQETLLRAWRSVDKLRDPGAVKSWLITTLRREHARLYERHQLDLSDIDECSLPDPESERIEVETDRAWLREQILALKAEDREPLALQVILGCSVAEIAELLDLTESCVMTRLFRARKRLLARLEAPAGRTAVEAADGLS